MSKVSEIGWKKYDAVHHWLVRKAGRPKRCDNSSCSGVSQRYEWSNISGEYKRDLSDWQRLCRSCHAYFDRNNRCNKGHEYTTSNTYTAPKTGIRQCKECRRGYAKAFYERSKLCQN